MIRRGIMFSIVYCVCLSLNAQVNTDTLRLFTDSLKQEISPILCDFLERYLNQVSKSSRDYDFYQRMADDKVVLKEGSFGNIHKLSTNVLFTPTRYEDKGYEVCWKDTLGNVLLCLQFPIKYELLLGKTKDEVEKTMKEQLTACPDSICLWKADTDFVSTGDGLLRSKTSDYYYVKSLNMTTYYYKSENDSILPIFSTEQKAYSATNLFHGLISDISNYMIYIEQDLYGFKKESYIIPLTKWLNYCKKNKLAIYFGIEEERSDGLKALLIAKDKDLAYCHLMTIILADNFVDKRNSVLKAMLNAYIPIDNVENLYQELSKEKSK